MVRPPTRPILRMSPSPATPSVSEANTRGTIVIRSIRRKIWPTGPATLLPTHCTLSAAHSAGIPIQATQSAPVANAFATGADWVAWIGIPAEWAADKVQWVGNNVAGPVGQIFLRMLLMTIVPLVFASLTLGVAGLGD